MFTRLHQWILCLSLERDRPLPRFVARRIERNPQLKWFYEQARALPERLSADAADLNESDDPVGRITPESRWAGRWVRPAALASALVLVAALLTARLGEPTPDEPDADLTLTPDVLVDRVAMAMGESLHREWRRVAADGAALARIMLSPLPDGAAEPE